MEKFESTAFITQFDHLDESSVDYGMQLGEVIFAGDDCEIKVSIDLEEHPEMRRLTKGKFYRIVIDSYEI